MTLKWAKLIIELIYFSPVIGFIPCLLVLWWRDKHQEKLVVYRFLDYINWRTKLINEVLLCKGEKNGVCYSEAVYKHLEENDR